MNISQRSGLLSEGGYFYGYDHGIPIPISWKIILEKTTYYNYGILWLLAYSLAYYIYIYIYVQYVYCKTGITNSMATMMMIYGDILTTIEDLWIIGGGVLPQKVGSVPEHS